MESVRGDHHLVDAEESEIGCKWRASGRRKPVRRFPEATLVYRDDRYAVLMVHSEYGDQDRVMSIHHSRCSGLTGST